MKNLKAFLSALGSHLSSESILTDPHECNAYGTDWTRQVANVSAVLLPRSTDQVAKILSLANELEIQIVPSGGRTGLAGGAVASKGEVVLSLSKMNRIDSVDRLSKTVRVQSGAITEAVHEHCKQSGLLWPIDLAAKGTCEIGGNLSTNAGGVRVIRYGMTRKWVTALQVVTMQGEIIELNRNLEKNNTGYDLLQLIIGSEGTLAVITEATLKLTRLPRFKNIFLFSVTSLEQMARLCEEANFGPFHITAFEFFSQKCLHTVQEKLKRISRIGDTAPFYVLMEIERSSNDLSEVEEWLGKILEESLVVDGSLAQSSEDEKASWGLREGITESIAVTGPVRKYDVAVPVSQMVPFLTEGQKMFSRMNLSIDLYLFGHFGDGSPHFNLVKKPDCSMQEFSNQCDRFEIELFALLKRYGGSVSAEHGVGNLKKHWVTYSRTNRELELYRSIKKAFDPKHLLNPGKILDI
jgi:FAD/FMN-containing dehydrogenase